MQWVIIVINLGVHVLLYAYYGLYEMKVNIWWKKVRGSDEQTGEREGEGEAGEGGPMAMARGERSSQPR